MIIKRIFLKNLINDLVVMITGFFLRNYKGFPKLEFNFKSINILLGKNSVGKSSILEFIMLISQTLKSEDNDKPLILNGRLVKAGSVENLFHQEQVGEKKVTADTMEFTFFDDQGFNLSNLIAEHKDTVIARLLELYEDLSLRLERYKNENSGEGFDEINKNLEEYKKIMDEIKKEVTPGQMDFLYYFIDFHPGAKKIFSKIDPVHLIQSIKEIYNILSNYWRQNKENSLSSKTGRFNNLNHQLDVSLYMMDFLNQLTHIKKNKGSCRLRFERKDDNIFLKSIEYLDENKKIILGITRSFKRKFEIVSEISPNIIKYSECLKDTLKFINFLPKIDRNTNGRNNAYRDLISFLRILFEDTYEKFNDTFGKQKILHISPLRANPKRHYILDDVFEFSSEIGESVAQELSKRDVKEKVNEWLRNFDISIDINSIASSLLKTITVNQYGINRDIVDVGFGISQILPILVQGFIAKEGSIILIEQPEIHLHPKMQADLADLFIDICKKKKVILIIETHSEYILNRLKLRMIQSLNKNLPNKNYSISVNDLNIFFLGEDGENKGNKMRQVKIEKYGKFEFPAGFNDSELEDIGLYLQNLLEYKTS